ncbi:MAG: segregation/condensation protein A [Alphaproteobacteria bacterium]|nr:segregation/condensation protein A [Alphaproteobacteria bacterium]
MSEAEASKFEDDLLNERSEGEQLMLYLGDFDGPIDMLLTLARDQKVDLAKISILALANQYIDFIEKARALRLELAADYLVMAAWLAYLKSRMLIPQEEKKQAEPSAQDLAEALQFQLRRLEAMRKVANDLFHLPRLGYNVFARGEPEGLKTEYVPRYEMTFYDLLRAYGDIKQRQQNAVYKLNPVKLFSLEEAIERMEHMLGKIPQEWVSLFMFLPGGVKEKIVKRSAVASTFGGALEMAKRGLLKIHQEKNYGPIYIRRPGEKDDEVPPPAVPEEESGISAEDIAFAENDLAEQQAEEAAKEAERLAAEQALAEANAAPAARYVPSSDSEDDGEDDFGAEALGDTAPEAAIDEADVEVALLETEADETSAPDMQVAAENTEEVTVLEVVEETSAVEAAVETAIEVAEEAAPRVLTEDEEWELLLAEEAAEEEAKRKAAEAAAHDTDKQEA